MSCFKTRGYREMPVNICSLPSPILIVCLMRNYQMKQNYRQGHVILQNQRLQGEYKRIEKQQSNPQELNNKFNKKNNSRKLETSP